MSLASTIKKAHLAQKLALLSGELLGRQKRNLVDLGL